jgi:hypothetical protein
MTAATIARRHGESVDASSADRWFVALDQRQIGSGASSWVAQVMGVHQDRDDVWVQVAPSDDADATIIVHLTPETPLADVLAALARRNPSLDRRPEIIDLAAWAGADSLAHP